MTAMTRGTDQHAAIDAARSRATALLRLLEQARDESEQRLAEAGQPDHLKRVTGSSSIENAITATRRMIETIDRRTAERGPTPVVTSNTRDAVSRMPRLARVS